MNIKSNVSLKKGISFYAIRQIVLFVTGVFFNLYITKILYPGIFGELVIFNAYLGFYLLFCDGSLFSGIIQSKNELNKDMINAVITFQLFIYFVLVILTTIFVMINLIFNLIKINYIFLCFSLISAIASSFSSGFSIVYQKLLNFKKISISDIISNFVYYISSIILIFFMQNIYPLLFALLLKVLTQFVLLKIKFKFDFFNIFRLIKPYIKSGLLMQINTLIIFGHSIIDPIIGIKYLGTEKVGLLNRAAFFAGVCIQIVNVVIQKTLFPFFSKLQDDKERLKEKIYQVFAILAIFEKIFYIPLFLEFDDFSKIFFGVKWDGITKFFMIFCIQNLIWGTLNAISSVFLLSLKKFKLTMFLNFFSCVLSFLFAVTFVTFFGDTGYAIRNLIISPIALIAVFQITKYLGKTGILKLYIENFIITSLTILLFIFVKKIFNIGIMRLIIISSGSIIFYSSYYFLFHKNKIRKMIIG